MGSEPVFLCLEESIHGPPFSPIGARLFRMEAETTRKWVEWRMVGERVADMCLCGWVSREQLGEGIKCKDLLASSSDPSVGLTPGYKYKAWGFRSSLPSPCDCLLLPSCRHR
jgi:hypothetical protein